jgi:hypothetical protein
MNDRIVVGTLENPYCKVRSQLETLLQSHDSEDIDTSLSEESDFDDALGRLSNGEVDVLAVSASELIGKEEQISMQGCLVIGAQTPRRPSLVLVSPDRLSYQPNSAIIVSEHEVVRRQLLRARPDLSAISPESFAEGGVHGAIPDSNEERARWLGTILQRGEIDGFVISRAEYENSEQTERRHTLMPFPKERGDPRFLPVPYSDLVAILARPGLPNTIAEWITEPEGNTALWVQSRLLNEMDEALHGVIGMQVRHRQVGALLRQAEDTRDLVLRQACHNPEGEIIEDEVRVEVKIETISADGRRTLSLERLVSYSDYQHAVITLLRDWDALMLESFRFVPKDHPSDEDAPPFIY